MARQYDGVYRSEALLCDEALRREDLQCDEVLRCGEVLLSSAERWCGVVHWYGEAP